MSLEEYTISRYMELPERIQWLERRQKEIRREFYQQSFYTHTAYSDLGIFTEAMRPEIAIEMLEETEKAVQRRLEITRFKYSFWRHFLNELPSNDRHYFTKKYKYHHHLSCPPLEQKAFEEIEGIEEAISLRYNDSDSYLPEIELDENDPLSNIENLLSLVE